MLSPSSCPMSWRTSSRRSGRWNEKRPTSFPAGRFVCHCGVGRCVFGFSTGSFNFTASAQKRNAENLLVIRYPEVAAQYRANWLRREAQAEGW